MHHNHPTSRHQLRPPTQILLPLPRNIKPKPPPNTPPNHPPRHNLTCPRNHRRIKCQFKRIHLARIIEREIRVYVFVPAEMEDDDFGEKGEHGDVFGDGADEDVAAAVFEVEGVGLRG